MLFTRLYNWIKYKTLPPSVLFLNRLFVERDSKHRRVTSNLGLTFRNSKWSTYARTNINLSSRTAYISTLLKFFVGLAGIAALTSFSTYFYSATTNSFVYSVLWFLFDADVYLKLIFSSSVVCSLQLVTSRLSNLLYGTLFGTTIDNAGTGESEPSLQIPKRLHKPIFYAWLTNHPSSSSYQNLFDTKISSSQYGQEINLFTNLFQSSRLLSLASQSSENVNSLVSSLSNSTSSKPANYDMLADISLRLNLSSLDYGVFGPDASSKSACADETTHWVISSIHSELSNNTFELKDSNGLFYLPNFSYSDLNRLSLALPETSNFRNSITDQLKVIQWNRWIYKYNILHRSLLKTASSITFTKRLLSSGFYNSSLLTNNIWAASAVKSGKLQNTEFGDLTRSIYGDFSRLNRSNSQTLRPASGFFNSNGLDSLKFYELSYYWFIQRFYQLNTLGSNSVQLSRSLNSGSREALLSSLNSYQNSQLGLNTNAWSSVRSTAPNSTLPDSDIYLSYAESNLFSKSRLDSLQNLAVNSSAGATTFYSPKALK